MSKIDLKSLVSKLNPITRRSLEGAAGLCLSRTNYNVELEHWLLKLMEPTDTDIARVFKQYDIDTSRVTTELNKAMDKFQTGNSRAPELSPDLMEAMQEAWLISSLNFGGRPVRSGVLLTAMLTTERLRRRLTGSSKELDKISAEQITNEIGVLMEGTGEDAQTPAAAPSYSGGAPTGEPGATGAAGTAALDQYTIDLTERARKGEIDPVVGRDFEIRQVIDILTRRRQNNPILTGEAGVGKTAVVEGFALRIVAGDVPDPLKNVSLRSLDLALLQAGAGVKGEFENRLKSVIAEVKASPKPIIMFIDEAHTLIGAGGSAGQGDAANLLKPALARGELRTIAATTWMEYKKYFETDPALTRRFQVVKVEEPDVEKAILMMRGIAAKMEAHHNVRILEEAVADAVKLSHRYMTDRQLPDKSVSLLDTSCARVALSQSAQPAPIEDCRREIEMADIEVGILEREGAVNPALGERLETVRKIKADAEGRLAQLEARWQQEKELCDQLRSLREQLEAAGTVKSAGATPVTPEQAKAEPEIAALRKQYAEIDEKLRELQGENPLVQPVVTSQAVAEVVSGWTGIPIGKMVRNEINAVLTLKDRLGERVIGQAHALEAIAQRIRTARANLVDPRRPIGVFLLVGPSGVGKTETAMALADILYGGDRSMVIINMSEYKEEHKISRLTGSAPGYVGYGEGGVLTEAVRRKPYSIVLLDEIEKANENVQEIFYQVFDKGMLQDDKGSEINFKNTIILLTSNVGTDVIMKICSDPDTRPDASGLEEVLRPELLKAFKPALLGRMNVVPYFPLDSEVMKKIIELQINRIAQRMAENHGAKFSYDPEVLDTIVSRCTDVDSGARNVDHIINGTLLPAISSQFLARMAEGVPVKSVHVGVGSDGGFSYKVE